MHASVASSLFLPLRLALLALALGLATSAQALLWAPAGWKIASIVLAISLTWSSLIDIHRLILPDILTIGLVAIGLATHVTTGFMAWLPFLIGAAAGFAVLALVANSYARVRGHAGLGMGDAKLFAAAGAWLGWQALPAVLLAASGGALVFVVVKRLLQRPSKLERIPFGPFLAVALWGNWMFGPWLLLAG